MTERSFTAYQEAKPKTTSRPTVQRKAANSERLNSIVPPVVHEALRSPGQPLDAQSRAYFEPRFGMDFSAVRVHADEEAAQSAQAASALAYTIGHDVVFGAGQYNPHTNEGKRLMAHELTHVVQQGGSNGSMQPTAISREGDASEQEADRVASAVMTSLTPPRPLPLHHMGGIVQRTPARQVSCGSGPLHVPADPPFDVPDPVAVITAAENHANELLDGAIGELDSARQQILAGSPIGWPTISDALASGLRILGLNPDSDHFWRGSGQHTASLLLRRLRLIRSTIGVGSFFYTCLGPQTGTIGTCSGHICDIGDAASCAGSFRIVLCSTFWALDADVQGSEILHESAHNFAFFIQDVAGEREGIAACWVRFCETVAGIDESLQRLDLCANP